MVQHTRWPSLRTILKIALLAGLTALGIGIGTYNLHLTRDIESRAALTTRLIADLAGPVLFAEQPDPLSQERLQEAVEELDFPFVFTDITRRPLIWNPRQVGVPLPESLTEVMSARLDEEAPGWVRELQRQIAEYDRQNDPVVLPGPGGSDPVGWLHYGDSRLSRDLVFVPLLEAALVVLFMSTVLMAFRFMKRSEQRSIWVGMAKETAHQMGTPLTSLSGWLALLGEEDGLRRSGGPDRQQILVEIQHDVARLGKVSDRFSQIGSRPRRRPARVDQIVGRVCEYYDRRAPHLGKKVRIDMALEPCPEFPVSEQLLDWAVENLVKNALDALDKDEGTVRVSCRHLVARNEVEILVVDNGRGMNRIEQRRVFDPGYSTKANGWGMGLALVRRIVEEYHRGRVEVLRSVEGEGTTFRIRIPAV